MATMRRPATHRSWEDWTTMALGGLIALSPAFDPATSASHSYVLLNSIAVGFFVICLAMSELAVIERWDEKANLVAGLWLAASPFVLGYGGQLSIWHVVIGGLVAAIAALELWQDRTLRNGAG